METLTSGSRLIGRTLAYELGTDFNVVDYMRTDELGLSRLIADLLDPWGPHGQGERFLELFIKECGFEIHEALSIDRTEVLTEKTVSTGRLDILVQVGTSFGLVIENKPYAIEQIDQLDRYATYLDDNFKACRHLVYLTGYQLDSKSISADRIKIMNQSSLQYSVLFYNASEEERSLKNWLRNCAKNAQAPKMRSYLMDFSQWTDDRFPQLSNDTQEDIL